MSEIKVNSVKGLSASAAAISVHDSDGTCTLASGSKLNNCTTDGTTNFTIADGNLVVASGHGIDFSANGNASGMSSELLADYEEGSWTPDARDGSLTASKAFYIKIGNMVTVFYPILATSFASNADILLGTYSLPFTASATQGSNAYTNGIYSAWLLQF